jgi:hypothetical protein
MATNSPVPATSEAPMRGQISTKRATLDGNSIAGVPASINRSQFWIGRPSQLSIAKAPTNITTPAIPKVTMSSVSSERTATPPTGSGSITEKYRKIISAPKKFAPKISATSLREMSREDGWEVIMLAVLCSVKGVDFTKLLYFNDLLFYCFGYCCCAVSYSQFRKDMDEMRFNSCFGNE